MLSAPEPVYDQYITDIVEYFYSAQTFSPFAVQRARLVIIDSLGCAIETAHRSAACRAMLGPVVPNTTVPSGCRVPGTAVALDPVKAAFDLGTMIRYLDHNDGFSGREWGHPSDMLGAILAVADWQTRTHAQSLSSANECVSNGEKMTPSKENGEKEANTNGLGSVSVEHQPQPGGPVTMRQVIEATIKAFEVHCIFQLDNSFNERGFDHTILVKIGAVVAVTWLLGMEPSGCRAALSQAFQDGPMLRTYRQAPNTTARKGWAAGDACMRAVHLALLTRAGQTGAPTVLTDPKWGFYTRVFGGNPFKIRRRYGSFAIENNGYKLVAAEGHGIAACNAALEISQHLHRIGVPVHAIAKIEIRTMKAAITIIDKTGPLRNAADRDHCLQYMIAVTLLKRAFPDADDYSDDSEFAHNGRVERLRNVMHAYEDPQLTRDYFDLGKRTLAAGLTVTLETGEVLDEVLYELALGHVGHPGTHDAVLVKFRKNVALEFPADVADRVMAAVEDDDLPTSEMMDLLWKGSAKEETCYL